MKRIIFCLCSFLFGIFGLQAQERLAPDQNPGYKESQNKYSKLADSLSKNQGTTLQETYKAYDWYEAKLERKQQRRSWRVQNADYLNNPFYNTDFYHPYYFHRPYYRNIPFIWLDYRWDFRDRYRHRH